MDDRPQTLKMRVTRLRRSYLNKFPEALSEIRLLHRQLSESPSDENHLDDLCRFFHNIKGSTASFGLQDISAESAVGENIVRHLRGATPELYRKTLAELEACISRLESQSQCHLSLEMEAASISEAVASEVAPVDPSSDVKFRPRVFICDDEVDQAQQLGMQMTCFGYVVTTYEDPESLKKAVLADPPDAIIMDIMFPGRTSAGPEFIMEIRRLLEIPPPVIFLSGRQDFDARLKAVLAGGQAYFTKPVTVTELIETLDTLTVRHQPEPFRVLIIDDEPEVATFHSLLLEQAGMTTRLLHEPPKVLDVLVEFNPDLVLMDVYMPECSGRDLAQVIRQVPDFIGLPIVFLSSETDKNKQDSALQVGAEGFLTKPIQSGDLISTVTLRAERMRILRSLMVRDSLTGLFNHTASLQFLESAVASAKRNGHPVGLAMLDVDHFKKVNDTYGHSIGDQVLVALSRILRQRLRDSDLVGRYGGEEFIVITPNASIDETFRIVEQLRQDFSTVRFNAGKADFSCTFSGGTAGFPEFSTGEELREAADQALYAAKRQGRNRIVRAS
jgi:diguanylate cyclase (GGDEF)-like protein